MSDKKQCSENNKQGERCKAFAGESGVCFMHDAAKGKERAIARRNGGLATKQPHYADASVLPSSIRNIADVLIVLDYALQESVGLDNSARAANCFDCTRLHQSLEGWRNGTTA